VTKIKIRSVTPDEATLLTELTIRSKAYWGYSAEFMNSCREELAVTPNKILNNRYFFRAAERASAVIGFYTLEQQSPVIIELDALFVEPNSIGTGVGKALMNHAIVSAKNRGGRTLKIQADPNASDFYLAAGAILTGELESLSIPGRFLPTFEIKLPSHRNHKDQLKISNSTVLGASTIMKK